MKPSMYVLPINPSSHWRESRASRRSLKLSGKQRKMACSSSSKVIMEKEERPHVLAVDDSLVDRKLIERLLINSACKVTTVENGQRALEFLGLGDGQHSINSSDSKVNLIITDYSMPGMSGYELLKKVKESSDLKEIPVVIVSSENIQTRIKKCLEEGAQEFMLKPLRQSGVEKLISDMMKFRGGYAWEESQINVEIGHCKKRLLFISNSLFNNSSISTFKRRHGST
ncbi:hypothetical protein TEA_016136 [Camellia sinensis var. sinensis]|uniref:Response regulatory domain-containing protein n=1 Tax=Camellia sinensis var. sinensis TaxID=542762 RepID=A0A4S4D1H8_CAMSN|nr:hypothetical protein TEA_016136 [Camellia sinensis var. sinensis]